MIDNLDFLEEQITDYSDSQGRKPTLLTGAITYGTNNYPQGLGDYMVYGFDDFKQLEEFIEKFGGEAYHFRKRDGWQFWEKRGWATLGEPYTSDVYVNACGDNTRFAEFDTDFISERLHELADDFAGDGDFGPIELFINEQTELKEMLDNVNDDMVVIEHIGASFETIPNEMMDYHHDVWQYAIGVFYSKDVDFSE